jgi:23S rRNA pseudouridine1911/1915/1917 synthase
MALVQAEPRTGRTHQIRVHLSHDGQPIVGDRLYGGPGYVPCAPGGPADTPVPRPLLHARRLQLRHPRTGQSVVFEAPVPSDFRRVAEGLGLPLP